MNAMLLHVDMERGRLELSIRLGTPEPRADAEVAPEEPLDLRPELGNMPQVHWVLWLGV